ncbi:hypothetical protein BWQ96_07231 [Gracilariopsis chorda]|uniref:Uncharacterized protein n=1 Tax=Gracilariopsis chorda TaxID=448386 RepID=A0A2V3ILR7_9FLOR|nr:hypothetical protein BWQ96_07231 [Gracilariopsis chorda]|eukprot:PXF43034.1 hypothetical protein BWQ96_07231 [Gracilariopsis chorda]
MNDDNPDRVGTTPWQSNQPPQVQPRTATQDEFVFRLTQDRVARQLRILELHQIPSLSDVRDDVEMLVTILDRIQKKYRNRGRFHLIMENEVRSSEQEQSQSSENPHVETRILFSPTISFQGSDRRPIAERLADCLTAFALLDKRHPHSTSYALEYPLGNVPCPSPLPPPHPPFAIPHWYPGKEYLQHEVTEQRWQELIQSKLFINRQLARHFSTRDVHDVSQMYKRFFKTLHLRIKALNKCRMPRTLVYAEFTPPWIRRRICVGEQTSYLVRLTIPDLRNQRNRAGYQRMAFILAAFYEIEPMFSREILETLLRSYPPVEPGSQSRKRPMHPSQMVATAKAMARKKRQLAQTQAPGNEAQGLEVIDQSPQEAVEEQPQTAVEEQPQQLVAEEQQDPQQTDEVEKQLPVTEEPAQANPEPEEDGDGRILESQPSQDAEHPAELVCGAGADCLILRKDVVHSQDAPAVTGQCTKCRCPLHDLCGGGEKGGMLCRGCKGPGQLPQ